ncbi:hypothetical protein DRN43_05605 [Thermococci archaeon]|nr:MAG: hypothetical protein DRN43_05605 [Thermococci archaeon]
MSTKTFHVIFDLRLYYENSKFVSLKKEPETLENKAEAVGLDGWEKNYGLVAKKVENKEELKEKGFLVWDLDDFEP